MHTRLVAFGILIASNLDAGAPVADAGKEASAIAPLQSETTWGGPILGGGVKTSGEFTEGSLFLLQPLLDTIGGGGTMGGTVIFAEPYGTWAESGEWGASLGLGARHLFSDQSPEEARSNVIAGLLTEGFFVGGDAFIDYLNSAYDNDFWQVGFGIEAGTRYLEARANYYLPIGDDQTISRRTVIETRRSTRTLKRTFIYDPVTSGNNIVQDVVRKTIRRTTTTTTKRTFELFEEPLEGWDLELALLVPGIDRYCDVKLIGGYYDYEGDRSQSKIDGWRAGVEIRPVPAVVLHATWFQDAQLYRDNWLVGARLEIPLGAGLKEAFTPRRRHLAERLSEPVHRKNSAITTATGQDETFSSISNSSSTTTSSVAQNVIGTVPPPPPPPPPPPSDDQKPE